MNEDFLFDKPGDITESMRDGLARAYSIPGFRDYLLFAVRAANRNAMTLVRAGKVEEAKESAYKMSHYEKLLEAAKQCYERRDEMHKKSKLFTPGEVKEA